MRDIVVPDAERIMRQDMLESGEKLTENITKNTKSTTRKDYKVGKMQIANETRRQKADTSLSDVERFDRWVTDYAESHNMSKLEVVQLALFRLGYKDFVR